MALTTKKEETSAASLDSSQQSALCALTAFATYGLTVGILAYNAFSILPLPEVKHYFYAYTTAMGVVVVSGLLLGPVLNKIMNLGETPWIGFCACTGVLFLGIALSMTLIDLTAESTSSRSISRGLGLIWFLGVAYLFSLLTNSGYFRGMLNMVIIAFALLIPFVVGLMIVGKPKTRSFRDVELSVKAFYYPRANGKAIQMFNLVKNQDDGNNNAKDQTPRTSGDQLPAGWHGTQSSPPSAYTSQQAAPPPKPKHELLFTPVRNAASLPALDAAIQEVISKRGEMESFGFSSQITELNQTWNADQRAIVLDALLRADLQSDVQTLYISLLTDTNDDVASNAIKKYLFQPGLKSPEIALRSLGRLPDEAVRKLKEQPDVAPVVEHFIRSITENQPGADVLVPVVVELGDDDAIRRMFRLALRPSLNKKSVERIVDAWKARKSEPISPATLIYLTARSSSEPDPLDSEAIATLTSLEVEPAVQSQIAGIILASYRANPDAAKLNLLSKWADNQLHGRISKTLLDINKPEEFKSRELDFAMATAFNITEPLDHVLNVAMESAGTPPSAVIDYLKLDRARVEQTLLDKLERKGNSTRAGALEISLLEEVGHLKTRQTFATLARDTRLSVDDRRKFSEINEKLVRAANRERLSGSSGSSAGAASADKPSLNFNSDPAPKPPEKVKVTAGDVVEVRAGEKTERVIVTKVEPDILTVIYIDRGERLDFIGHERVIKVLGRSDDKDLIKPQTASAAQSGAQPSAGTASASAPATGPDAKSAASPENAKRPIAGLKVEAKKHGDWHAATIERVNGDKSYVTFDGKGAGWDDWLGLNDIRPIGSKKTFLLISFEP